MYRSEGERQMNNGNEIQKDTEAAYLKQGHRHLWLQPFVHLSVTTAMFVYRCMHQTVSKKGCRNAAALVANCIGFFVSATWPDTPSDS